MSRLQARPHNNVLRPSEIWWRDNYIWLLEQGYKLRPRYHPDWVPSWVADEQIEFWRSAEDSIPLTSPSLNDATQVSDGRHVVLKVIDSNEFPDEALIATYLAHHDDPYNCSVPVLRRLEVPGGEGHNVIVMPVLRQYDSPPFDTVGEVVDFIRQVLEGFVFLHEHRIVHRDVREENLMMDAGPLEYPKFHFRRPDKSYDYTEVVHPKFTRTERPPRYHIIDYGFSKQFSPEQMPPFEPPCPASDPSLPELRDLNKPCNPFPVDVYYVGNLLRMNFVDGNPNNERRNGCYGFEFLLPLVDAMTREEPSERIAMGEALIRFEQIVLSLSSAKLRSRVIPIPGRHVPAPGFISGIIDSVTHFCRTFRYSIWGYPPIPARGGSQLEGGISLV